MLKKGVAADSTVVPHKANDANGVAVEWSGTVKDLEPKVLRRGPQEGEGRAGPSATPRTRR